MEDKLSARPLQQMELLLLYKNIQYNWILFVKQLTTIGIPHHHVLLVSISPLDFQVQCKQHIYWTYQLRVPIYVCHVVMICINHLWYSLVRSRNSVAISSPWNEASTGRISAGRWRATTVRGTNKNIVMVWFQQLLAQCTQEIRAGLPLHWYLKGGRGSYTFKKG